MRIDISAEIAGHIQRNSALKDSFCEKGVNLADARSLELHFWSFSKQTAVMLAKALYDQGLLVLALSQVDSDNSRWTVEVGISDTIEHLTSDLVVRKFVELAAEYDSLYDGWGTTI